MAPTMATFLHNHDIFTGQRLWDQLHGDEARYRLAAASYLLLPGTPFIYYGEEIGLAGIDGKDAQDDAPLRAPMSWTPSNRGPGGFTTADTPFRPLSLNRSRHNAESQVRDAGSLFNFYRELIALRRASPALTLGRYEADQVDGAVWTFQRVHDGERVLVAINYGDHAAPLTLPPGARPLHPKGKTATRATATLPALSVRVYRLERP
jgi:glycosidase